MRPESPLCLAVCLSLALAPSCGSATKKAVAPESPRLESAELGDMRNVSAVGHVWLGGLPTTADLDLAKRRGIKRVIDLRVPEERLEYDLVAECKRLELECVSVNLQAADNPPSIAVDLVVEKLGEHDVQTLVFCSDGSRSAMFFAIHRVVNDGMPVEEALHEARRAGMQPGRPEEYVRDQVRRLGY